MATKPTTQAPKAAPKAKLTKGAAPAAPAAPATVALRGGPAVQRVALTGKPYRSAAKHNTDWWTTVVAACQQGDETGRDDVPVAALLEAKVPAHFIGYTMRRGYLKVV